MVYLSLTGSMVLLETMVFLVILPNATLHLLDPTHRMAIIVHLHMIVEHHHPMSDNHLILILQLIRLYDYLLATVLH
jgi:hypothetical protein